MDLSSFEGLIIALIFIVPGFIIDNVVNSFSPYGKRKFGARILYCLFYGLIHIALFAWLYALILDKYDGSEETFIALWTVLMVTVSVVLGFVFGLFKRYRWIYRILRKMHIYISSSIPSAWDYVFTYQKVCHVIVKLKGGGTIYGEYTEKSYVSTDPDERDLYLEKIYECVDTDDEFNLYNWVEIEDCQGMLITPPQIESIKFVKEDVIGRIDYGEEKTYGGATGEAQTQPETQSQADQSRSDEEKTQ